MSIQERHQKQLNMMRGFLDGKGWYMALDALELVKGIDTGTRKDGNTPAFHHQLSVARLVATLHPHLLYPEETIAASFLHDLIEDHGDIWTLDGVTNRFGQIVGGASWTLTKKTQGACKPLDEYYAALSECPISSIIKPADRGHNLQTMYGVFTLEKQERYVDEVDLRYWPMIRVARRKFPRQYMAYENLKIMLRSQCEMISRIHEATGQTRVGEP